MVCMHGGAELRKRGQVPPGLGGRQACAGSHSSACRAGCQLSRSCAQVLYTGPASGAPLSFEAECADGRDSCLWNTLCADKFFVRYKSLAGEGDCSIYCLHQRHLLAVLQRQDGIQISLWR